MGIRRGENKRESWWVRNNTNNTIAIGDLLLFPALKPGKRGDLLHFYTREKISHSKVLISLIKTGIVSLNKDKIFTDNNLPGNIAIRDADKSTTPAEENETGAILYHTTKDNVLIKTNLTTDTLQETNIIIDDDNNILTPGNINLETNKKIYFGDENNSEIFYNGTNLIIANNNPSAPGIIQITDNLTVDGVLKTLSGKIINRTSVTTSPYNILESDNHVSVTTSSIAITLKLPSIIDGTIYHIKDQDEQSSARNITVNPNDSDTIENASNLIIKINGTAITIIGNSTTNNWEIQ